MIGTIFKWLLRGAIAYVVFVLLYNGYTDIKGYDGPPEIRSTTPVPYENPGEGSLTWSADGRLLTWKGAADGKFVNAPLPSSLNAPKSYLCRLERASTPDYNTPDPQDTLKTYEYHVAAAGKPCDTGKILIWAQRDPSGYAIWFDPRTGLLLRHSTPSGTEGQTFCAGIEHTGDTWVAVDAYNGGGPFFDHLGCVRAANLKLKEPAPKPADKAAPAIKQVVSDILPLIGIPPCQDQFLTGCPN